MFLTAGVDQPVYMWVYDSVIDCVSYRTVVLQVLNIVSVEIECS